MIPLEINKEELKKLVKAIEAMDTEEKKITMADFKVREILADILARQVADLVRGFVERQLIYPPIIGASAFKIPPKK